MQQEIATQTVASVEGIVRLIEPEEATARWETISYAIQQSLPPIAVGNKARMAAILQDIVAKKVLCWLLATSEEGVSKIWGLATTTILFDAHSKTKSLLVYSLTNFRGMQMPDVLWNKCFEVLLALAKQQGCGQVIAYTESDSVHMRLTDAGFESQMVLRKVI